jgi:hypothetical protein
VSQPLSAAARTAPTVITASFWLWIASTVVSLIAFALLLPGLFGGAPVAGGIAAGSVAGAIIGSALRVFLAIYLLRGANWARIVLTVIGAVVLLTGIPSLLTGDLLGLLVVLVVVVAAVLMWLPAARPHFRRA